MKLTCLAITCGGTGGHFYPGLSIARVFQRQDGEVLLLLSGVNSEKQREIAESYGVPAVVLPRMPSPKHARQFAAGLAGGVTGAYRELGKFRPQALLGMGSFASFPAIFAARLRGIPCFLHDGNARIGKANRLLSRQAKVLATAFPPVNGGNSKAKRTVVTGMPVRPELEAEAGISKEEAVAGLNRAFDAGLKPDLPTVLRQPGGERLQPDCAGGAAEFGCRPLSGASSGGAG